MDVFAAMANNPAPAPPQQVLPDAAAVLMAKARAAQQKENQPGVTPGSSTKRKGSQVVELPPGKKNRQGGYGISKSCRACGSADVGELSWHRFKCEAYKAANPEHWKTIAKSKGHKEQAHEVGAAEQA
jgi:hypothetical protein